MPASTAPGPAARATFAYLPGLDGLRAVAVLGVIFFHLDLGWIPGGFLGVDVFFVLSGFLISSLLLEELDRSGRVDFGAFYLRRARRLLPALLLVLAFVAVAGATVARDAAAQIRQDLLPGLFFASNWWSVLADRSYFEAIGRPPLLQHLWSLAVEEQFYLLWPVLLLAAARWRGRRGVLVVAAAGALASTVLMGVLSVRAGYPLVDASRVYFGSDTHAMGLLVGAALATLWRPARLPREVAPAARRALDLTGWVALAAVLVIFWRTDQYAPWLYRGGFLLVALVVAVLVAVASHPASRVGPALGTPVLRYVGERSYGLYLWHWPVFMLTRPVLDVVDNGWPLLLGRLGLVFAIAEVSYRYVELPVRQGALTRRLRGLRERWRHTPAPGRTALGLRLAGVGAVAVLSTGFVGSALAAAPAPQGESYLGGDGVTSVLADADADVQPDVVEPSTPPPSTPAPASPPPAPAAAAPRASAAPAVPAAGVVRVRATIIGDSVVLGARRGLGRVLPASRIDASIARQTKDIAARIRALEASGSLAPVVVLHLGSNGIATPDQLRAILADLADRRVVLVTSAGPHPWQDYTNRTITKVAPQYDNVRVADWAAAAQGHPEYFVKDGVHLTTAGIRTFSNLVAGAVARA
jgi:peptidoglycan/LPS O-acetylase OafA/YrhL